MGMGGGDVSHELMRMATVELLVMFSYNVRAFQISGLPGWIDSHRYDIDTRPDDVTMAKLQAMPPDQRLAYRRLEFQSLLADRFKLVVHHSTIQGPMYSLIVAKPGKLPVAKEDCPAVRPPPEADKASCLGAIMWPGHLEENTVAIGSLINGLTTATGKIVVDNTGLTGKYNIALEWTPDAARIGPPDPNSPFPPSDASGPSLQEALQETLGLKLVPTTGRVDKIVIDHIEESSPN
jgi:uncharacterized protein (TIGR03435 family)